MAGFYVDRGLTSNRLFEDRNTVNDSNAYVTTETIPSVAPATTVVEVNSPTTGTINIQSAVKGFGGYLDGILPPDIATAAGAFSASMQQIKNISSIPVEKFAQVVTSLETTKGLNVNGSSVPTDTTLASQGLALIALGNGPYGTYTMSNFLGCMSGLPYLGINVRQFIQELETPTLYDIYKNLYLAVTWERATVSVQYSTYQVETDPGPPPSYTTYYHVTGLTITDPGGGYGRGGAAAPSITISNGGSGTTTIGTDYTNIGASGSYGRVISVAVSSAGSDTTSVPTATVDYPPGGSSFPTSDINAYIVLANAEILAIKNAQPARAQQLITNWENTGRLLSIEQRAIATGMSLKVPLAVPSTDREPTLAGYPTTQYAFVDSIPRYAKFTQPHMYSQTLEAISNLSAVGGRSVVGMLREARNQARLTELGIPLDNNIENKLTAKEEAQLIGNGEIPNVVPPANGFIPYPIPAPPTPAPTPAPTPSPLAVTRATYVGTVPATLAVVLPGVTLSTPVPYPASLESGVVSPDTYGYYDPTTNDYFTTNRAYQGTGITANTLDSFSGSLDGGGSGGSGSGGGGGGSGGGGAGIGGGTPTGLNAISGIGSLLDTGQAIEPGSFAGSPYQTLISPELNSIYTSRSLLPSTYTIQEAIDEVIRCNCDCWDNV